MPISGLLLLPIRTFVPSAPPGGTAAEEDPGESQYPDDDGNRNFAGGDHACPVRPTLFRHRPFVISVLLRQQIADPCKLDIRRISRPWR